MYLHVCKWSVSAEWRQRRRCKTICQQPKKIGKIVISNSKDDIEYVICGATASYLDSQVGRGGEGGVKTFVKTALEFLLFFTLSLEIPDKTKLNPWIFHKIVLDPLRRNSRVKNKDSWKFQIIFSWSPLEIPRAFSLIGTPGNSISSTPLFGFFLE